MKLNVLIALIAAVGFVIGLAAAFGLVPLHVTCPPGTPATTCNGYNGLGGTTSGTGGSGLSSASWSLFRPTYTSTSNGLTVTATGSCSPATATITQLTLKAGSTLFHFAKSQGCGSFSFTQALSLPVGTYVLSDCIAVKLGTTSYTGCSGTTTGIVPAPPPSSQIVASFRATVSGLTVNVTDTSYVTGTNVSSVVFAFGDGATASLGGTGRSTSHAYALSGTYTVTDTVTGSNGQNDMQTQAIEVAQPTPPGVTAAFAWSTAALVATFTDQSLPVNGHLLSESWSFGDGMNGSGPTLQHTYATAGTYTVTETVLAAASDGTVVNGTVSHAVSVAPGASQQNQSTQQPSAPASVVLNPVGAAMMVGFGLMIPFAFLPGRWLAIGVLVALAAGTLVLLTLAGWL